MKVFAVLAIIGAVAALPAPQKGACNAQQVQQLAAGIQQNLDIQAQELQGCVPKLLSCCPRR